MKPPEPLPYESAERQKGTEREKKPHRGKSEGTGADKPAPAGEGARKPRKRVERSEREGKEK